MSNPTRASDLEFEEHDKTYGVKKVRMYGYDGTNLAGVKVNSSGELQIDTAGDNYALKLDDTTTANVTYIGKAAIGSASASAVWQIKKMDETTGLVITWADSNDSFDNVWDNRAALSYG